MAARLVDASGADAVVGRSEGYWLSDSDFVSTQEACTARTLGSVGFPRDWPNVYTSNKPLKSLIGKKGRCAGKKVGVVGAPLPEELDQVGGLTFQRLQSFSNAESVQRQSGFPVVQGWAVFEHLDLPVGAAFVAERYWWNALPEGKWVDFTPRPAGWSEMLLAEAAGDASKAKAVLAADELEILRHLSRERFGVDLAAASSSSSAPAPAPAQRAPAAPAAGGDTRSSVPAAYRDLVERIKRCEAGAVRELEEKLKGDEELAVQIAGANLAAPLSDLLKDAVTCEDALKLVLLLSDAAVGQRNVDVANGMIDAGIVPQLVRLLSAGSATQQELAAACLGNLCHESPANQDKLKKHDPFKPLADLLGAETGPAQEAAYAIWNLTVGHMENSERFVRLGVVPKLTELLKSSSDVAQENAAGALMHVTMTQEARNEIVRCNAIPRLTELLKDEFEPEVSSQAAGALLNLASDCTEYADKIVRAGAVKPLVELIKSGQSLAKEYAAGALMNVMRDKLEVATEAAKAGAIPALAAMLSKPSGVAEALGALANLASGSSERQIAIYKAQVTRRTVALLTDPDEDTRRSAAALMMNMSPQAKIKERIVEAGALKPLAKVLTDSDAAVKERAAGALANLFNDHAANVLAGFKEAPEMIPSLVAICADEAMSHDARRQSAHALAMLAAEDGPVDSVWAAGAGPPLVALLKDRVAEAALAIMNLSWRWPDVKADLAKSGVVEYLMALLERGGDDPLAKEYAAGGLMNITAGSPDNAELAVRAVRPLVDLLKPTEGYMQAAEWAAGALANITRVGEAPQNEAVDGGAVRRLADLLPQVTPAGRSLVVLALTSLAEHHKDAIRQVLSGPKESATVKDFRRSTNEELADYTHTLADKLGMDIA